MLPTGVKSKEKNKTQPLHMAYTSAATCLISLWGRDTTQHNTEKPNVYVDKPLLPKRFVAAAATRSNFSRSSAAGISGVLTLAGCQQTGFVCQTSLQSPLFVVSRRCTLAQTDVALDWMQVCTLTHHKKKKKHNLSRS